jgi:uncharacterized membrane protein YeiH
MEIIQILDYLGIFFFAMSGILAASEIKLDLFGGFVIAFVTAIGGGTLRDLLLNIDIVWVSNVNYVYIIIVGVAFGVVFKKILRKIRKTLFLFDTIGISLFTIIGVQKAISLDVPTILVIVFGVISATFGGVIRDTLCNEIPLIFRKEVYATACIIGAVCYVILFHFNVSEGYCMVISGSLIMAVRTIAVVKKVRIPILNESI